jgi:hypothetical protein
MAAPLLVLLALVVVLGFWPGAFEVITGPAAQSFVSMFGGQAATTVQTLSGH